MRDWIGRKGGGNPYRRYIFFCSVNKQTRGGDLFKASPRGEVDAYADGEVYIFVWIAYGSSFFNRNNYYHLSGGYTATSLLANLALSEAKYALLKESL